MTEETTQQPPEQQTVSCYNCGKDFCGKDFFYYNQNIDWRRYRSRIYCMPCFHELTGECENCGLVIYRTEFEDNSYCSDCYRQRQEDNEEWDDDTSESDGHDVNYCELRFEKIASKSFKVNPHKNFCGVEIECLNSKLYDKEFNYEECKKYGFSQISDGSLNSGGAEYVSQAFNGDELFNRIKKFCTELKKRSFRIDESCGLHIHIAVPKRAEYLRKIYLFYLKFEDYFFRMLPQSRQNNEFAMRLNREYYSYFYEILNYATKRTRDFMLNPMYDNSGNFKPLSKMESIKKSLYETRSNKQVRYSQHDKYNNKRYFWLNFHSIFYRGTLEIRSHSGTIEADKINNWLAIHLHILNKLKKMTYEDISLLSVDEYTFLSFFSERKIQHLKKYIIERWHKFKNVVKVGDDISLLDKLDKIVNFTSSQQQILKQRQKEQRYLYNV